MDEKKNSVNEDIYSSLKGYFPDKYDMTPDELECAIDTENKERGIALGFTDPNRTSLEKPAEVTFPTNAASESVSTIKKEKTVPIEDKADPEPEAVENSGHEDITDASTDEEDDMFFDSEEAPEAQVELDGDGDLTKNGLFLECDPLDSLFDELEEQPEENVPVTEKKDIRKVLDWFFDFLEVFTVCTACIILAFSFCGRLTRVDGTSMNDTLANGEYLLVSNIFYTPRAGDIVVLQNTSAEAPVLREPLVKRIIAVGGETVHIEYDGTVTVTDEDGKETVLDQSFVKNEPYMKGEGTYVVPEGSVFVMGDNRNNSTDSRDSRVGMVDERCIFGKAYLRLLPLQSFTLFKNPYSQ